MRARKLLPLSVVCAASVACGVEQPPPGDTEGDSTTNSSGEDASGGPTSSSETDGSSASSSSSGLETSTGAVSTSVDTTADDTGTPCDDRECTDPPAAACSDPFTVSAPAAAGACVDGACQCAPELLDCP